MNNISLQSSNIHKGSLILVNHDYPYKPDNSLAFIEKDGITLEKRTFLLIEHILKDIHHHQKISLISGYRSLEEQTSLYHNSLIENGKEFTQSYVAFPGTSEHQTGLAIDLALTSQHIDFLRPHFPNDGIAQTFRHYAYQYGFIQRYQKHKEAITHIKDEPWHFRYVGIPHAMYMLENDLCLEEYIDLIKQYSLYHPLHYYYHNRLFTIFYVPLSHDMVKLSLKDNRIYQVSGNNQDGFIVTTWSPYV